MSQASRVGLIEANPFGAVFGDCANLLLAWLLAFWLLLACVLGGFLCLLLLRLGVEDFVSLPLAAVWCRLGAHLEEVEDLPLAAYAYRHEHK